MTLGIHTTPARETEATPICKKCGKSMRQVGSKAPLTCWTCDCDQTDGAEATPKEKP